MAQETIVFASPFKNKFHELEKLFVDSLRTFETKEFAIEDIFSTADAKVDEAALLEATRQAARTAFAQFNQPVLLERRWILDVAGQVVSPVAGLTGVMCVAVAYTANGEEIHLYDSKIGGTVVEARGASEDALDTIWQVEGYTKTLAELGEHCCFQNEPYLQVASLLRQHVFNGVMEIHIFVLPLNPSEEMQAQFKEDCKNNNMKACNLRLDFLRHGYVAVLMSSRYVMGTMDKVWRETFHDARVLARLGYDVCRTKIEATASITGVPATTEEALRLPNFTYFEFHMIFTKEDGETPTAEDVERVKVIAKRCESDWNMCIPLSANAFLTHRFVNMRTYRMGRDTAIPQLDLLGSILVEAGYKVPRYIREFGVYDSKVEIDCGWLEPEEPAKVHSAGFLPPLAVN
eukprot:TRINITY_DN4927_c0_g1_i1.p1 TRINITY_DN4927_c0_g1~~TRINITY_DN4927_c0_g1_i1.p1  ORF type:complete len:436 (-),score=191.53 TRINITY_DN4927_c0_g1_i1:140-1351(-)